MSNAIIKSTFKFKGQIAEYNGKVRDVYTLDNGLLVMVASDRISAFDHVLPKGIPFKGQVLNQVATMFLKATESNNIVAIACKVKNHPRVWSTPSAMKSAG